MQPTIVFSHANSFPAGTYRVLFDTWRAAGYDVQAVERFGHDPKYPVTSNWPMLRKQLIEFLEALPAKPVYLVGHSLGGLLSVFVACRRPDLVRGLVLLDSPLIVGWRAHGLRVAKATGLMKRVSPGHISRRRRHEWPSRDAVKAHFASKHVFARWDPRVLDDYVASGFEERDGKTVLAFNRDIETRIYNNVPHDFAALLHRHPLKVPMAFLAGRQSPEMRMGGVHVAHALAKDRFEWCEGSHLFPMEKPEATAKAVLRLIDSFS